MLYTYNRELKVLEVYSLEETFPTKLIARTSDDDVTSYLALNLPTCSINTLTKEVTFDSEEDRMLARELTHLWQEALSYTGAFNLHRKLALKRGRHSDWHKHSKDLYGLYNFNRSFWDNYFSFPSKPKIDGTLFALTRYHFPKNKNYQSFHHFYSEVGATVKPVTAKDHYEQWLNTLMAIEYDELAGRRRPRFEAWYEELLHLQEIVDYDAPLPTKNTYLKIVCAYLARMADSIVKEGEIIDHINRNYSSYGIRAVKGNTKDEARDIDVLLISLKNGATVGRVSVKCFGALNSSCVRHFYEEKACKAPVGERVDFYCGFKKDEKQVACYTPQGEISTLKEELNKIRVIHGGRPLS